MAFTFAQPLKLLAIGGSLITSTSFWFFNPSASITPLSQARSPEQPTAKVSVAVDDDENINRLESAPRLAGSSSSTKVDSRIKNPATVDSNSFSFTIEKTGKQIVINYGSWQRIDDFGVANIMGKRSQYKEISREDIKIKLFKEHAWFSTSNPQIDEYKDPLNTEEINELFTGVDETKAKQLLLSLQKNIEWKFWYPSGTTDHYIGQIPFLSKVSSPEGLEDLKIKYFSDFSSLKEYVHKKVNESCRDDDKACVAYPEELIFPKTDTKEYLNQ